MRKDTQHLIKGTPASIRVCQRIAEMSKGVCTFGFSRGKDSICAWIWLRRFFHTIIPFHCCSVPHISFVDRSLAYYEKEFEAKIERCMSGDTLYLLNRLVFQPGEDEPQLMKMEKQSPGQWSHYGNNEVADLIKSKYNLPQETYTAYGISLHDNVFRRLRMTEKGGKIKKDAGYRDSARTFFPCFDWTTSQVMRTVELSGLRLPDDYRLGNRTIANGMDIKHLSRLKHFFPEDFKRVKAMFPFIECHLARNEFRRLKHKG